MVLRAKVGRFRASTAADGNQVFADIRMKEERGAGRQHMTSSQPEQAAGPPFGGRNLIPDEATALQVGVAILTAYFGKELVARFEPYQAVLLYGKWAVMGDSPVHKEARREQERLGPDHFIAVRGGGAPEITLSPIDARVEHIALAR